MNSPYANIERGDMIFVRTIPYFELYFIPHKT